MQSQISDKPFPSQASIVSYVNRIWSYDSILMCVHVTNSRLYHSLRKIPIGEIFAQPSLSENCVHEIFSTTNNFYSEKYTVEKNTSIRCTSFDSLVLAAFILELEGEKKMSTVSTVSVLCFSLTCEFFSNNCLPNVFINMVTTNTASSLDLFHCDVVLDSLQI